MAGLWRVSFDLGAGGDGVLEAEGPVVVLHLWPTLLREEEGVREGGEEN